MDFEKSHLLRLYFGVFQPSVVYQGDCDGVGEDRRWWFITDGGVEEEEKEKEKEEEKE